jgi:hypothetical protein
MSTHALGNVQLITVQEVEAMLDEVVVPEASIDVKVAAEATAREAADQLLQGNIDNEKAERDTADTALQSNITAEAKTRQTADDTLNTLISQEAQSREVADTAFSGRIATIETELTAETDRATAEEKKIRDEMKQTEVEKLSNVNCSRLKNLPIATIQVDNDDKSISVGDTIATVSARYLPKIPVDFVMSSEQMVASANKTFLLMLRLDITGNINVINMIELAEGSSATDTATVTYFTQE